MKEHEGRISCVNGGAGFHDLLVSVQKLGCSLCLIDLPVFFRKTETVGMPREFWGVTFFRRLHGISLI